MKTKILLVSAVSISASLFSQNVGINSTGAAPVNSAALDVDMSDKGLLIPRVALTSTTVFTPITGTSTISLLVYNSATAGVSPNNVTPGFYFWNGTKWEKITSKTEENTVGDVKQGFQISDHNGWVLLDGRMISTLLNVKSTNCCKFSRIFFNYSKCIWKGVKNAIRFGDDWRFFNSYNFSIKSSKFQYVSNNK